MDHRLEEQKQAFFGGHIDSVEDLLRGFFPFEDYGRDFELSVQEIMFTEPASPEVCVSDGYSYVKDLQINCYLRNMQTGWTIGQQIWLCSYPWMTSNGTFIAGGNEMVTAVIEKMTQDGERRLFTAADILFRYFTDGSFSLASSVARAMAANDLGHLIDSEIGPRVLFDTRPLSVKMREFFTSDYLSPLL